jgi:hypothetical protein
VDLRRVFMRGDIVMDDALGVGHVELVTENYMRARFEGCTFTYKRETYHKYVRLLKR